jgi:hypothetical protein
MRKTVVLLLSAAFVATLPSIASAKKVKHRHHRQAVVQAYNDENTGPRFLGAALHQFIVPFEVTFAPRQY